MAILIADTKLETETDAWYQFMWIRCLTSRTCLQANRRVHRTR